MKRYIRAFRNFPGSIAVIATNNLERLYCKDKLRPSLRWKYMNMFSKVFKVQPFYLEDGNIVDAKTQEIISGPELSSCTYKELTTFILDYFDIPISEDTQKKIDRISRLSIYLDRD